MQNSLFENTQPNNEQKQALRQCSVMGSSGLSRYDVIYADPPWPIKWNRSPGIRTRQLDYQTMPIAEMCMLDIKSLANPDGCTLFMWTTNGFLPEAMALTKVWGFHYEMLFTWCKNNGMGGHPRNATEHMIIATLGTPTRGHRNMEMTLNWGCFKLAEHSKKPNEVRKMIERITEGKRVELFARQKHEGWDVWGNQVVSDVELGTSDSYCP
jgi:N6-adenosine-specific RNA methylase IME4